MLGSLSNCYGFNTILYIASLNYLEFPYFFNTLPPRTVRFFLNSQRKCSVWARYNQLIFLIRKIAYTNRSLFLLLLVFFFFNSVNNTFSFHLYFCRCLLDCWTQCLVHCCVLYWDWRHGKCFSLILFIVMIARQLTSLCNNSNN